MSQQHVVSDHSFGAPLTRFEDHRFLTATEAYTADLTRHNILYLGVVRSPYAHAQINAIEATAARQMTGIHAVYTAADIKQSGIPGVIPHHGSLPTPDDSAVPTRILRPLVAPTRPLLAEDMVRYHGEPVAVVVGDDPYAVSDAVERVDVAYDRTDLTAFTNPVDAAEADESIHTELSDNVAFEWERGDKQQTDNVFGTATRTVNTEVAHQRILPSPIEPRAALAEYDSTTGQLTVWQGNQGVRRPREYYSKILGLDPGFIRVRTPAVGGGFGTKGQTYAAELLVAWCAIQTGKPVKWVGTRTETSLSDAHGRAQAVTGELAFTDEGDLLGLRVVSHADLGAYICGRSPGMHTSSFAGGLPGQYTIPAIYCRVVGAFTTMTPVGSYRATSRPQSILMVERLIELAARELNVDPAVIRRRNFVPPDAFPYQTPMGPVYDSGAYEACLDRALELIEYDRVRADQRARDPDEFRLGIGIGCSTDSAGGRDQSVRIHVRPNGMIIVDVTTVDGGQGHWTTFPQLLASELGVSPDSIELRQGDSDRLSEGAGTAASRSAVGMDETLTACANDIIETGRKITADAFEAHVDDIGFADTEFYLEGSPDRSMDLFEVAERTMTPQTDGLVVTTARSADKTYPSATHIAVVEVDPTTGNIDLKSYVAVTDCGPAINPRIVEGQVHGSIVQGIGQVLGERAEYSDTGILQNTSFQDYALPRTTQLPDIEVDLLETPSPLTPHGVKGMGEVGTSASVIALTNAILDAQPDLVPSVRLPIRNEECWHATQ